jgi:hypothetical protein
VTCGLYEENREFDRGLDQFFKTLSSVQTAKDLRLWTPAQRTRWMVPPWVDP